MILCRAFCRRKNPPQLGLTVPADTYGPDIAPEPGEFIRRGRSSHTPLSLAETADFKDMTIGIGKCMGKALVNLYLKLRFGHHDIAIPTGNNWVLLLLCLCRRLHIRPDACLFTNQILQNYLSLSIKYRVAPTGAKDKKRIFTQGIRNKRPKPI